MLQIQGMYLVGGLRFHKSISSFLIAVEQALAGGVKLFQLRVKEALDDKDYLKLARMVRELTLKYNTNFILNDRADLALLCDADGVHLGPDDMDLADARKILGKDKIIGLSSHNFEEAQMALNESPDYLSVGPIYETDCKKTPDAIVGTQLFEKVLKITNVPLVAIGGITTENLSEIVQSGAKCFGVIRGVMQSNNIQFAVQEYIQVYLRLKNNFYHEDNQLYEHSRI